jgi:hypothetical protein
VVGVADEVEAARAGGEDVFESTSTFTSPAIWRHSVKTLCAGDVARAASQQQSYILVFFRVDRRHSQRLTRHRKKPSPFDDRLASARSPGRRKIKCAVTSMEVLSNESVRGRVRTGKAPCVTSDVLRERLGLFSRPVLGLSELSNKIMRFATEF